MKVKVILQADIAGLGEEGEIKEVAGGYARNYLLPRKMVVPATKGAIKMLDQQRTRIDARQEQFRTEARALAEKLVTLPLSFDVRVGEQGRLFGSVTAQEIADQLKEAGVVIDRRSIDLREPLRALGEYEVPIRIAHAVTGRVKVTLRDQNAPRVAAQAATEATDDIAAAETDPTIVEEIEADNTVDVDEETERE